MEFYNSSKYNPDYRYSFIIQIQYNLEFFVLNVGTALIKGILKIWNGGLTRSPVLFRLI